jgi:peptide/nickel transport system substrate-binding protein
MKILRLAMLAAGLLLSLQAGVHAQTTLRIGLAEDPDILDPTMARTYVGRIVFASFCDKLFDIDEKLNIVPQLALSHETSADGKEMTIKLRPGVKFHDGEPFDAEAAKFSLERHLNMQGSFRKPELATVDHVDVVDPLTIKLVLKTPFSPLIAQLTDRAGMMVSPKAARRRATSSGCIRFAPAPTNSSSGCSRTASYSRNSPTTGTRTTSSSTAWFIFQSSIRRCGSPILNPAAST